MRLKDAPKPEFFPVHAQLVGEKKKGRVLRVTVTLLPRPPLPVTAQRRDWDWAAGTPAAWHSMPKRGQVR